MTRVKKVWAALIGLLVLGPTQVFSQKKISIAFDVQLIDYHTVNIQWTRPGEDGFDYDLEKSRDEQTWARIANINSQLSPCYDYIDLHAVGRYQLLPHRAEKARRTGCSLRLEKDTDSKP